MSLRPREAKHHVGVETPYCGAPARGRSRCGDWNGESVCPMCGGEICPTCVAMADVKRKTGILP